MNFRSGNLVENKQTLPHSVYSTDPIGQFLTGQLSDSTRRAYEADLRHFFSFWELKPLTLRQFKE